MFVRGSCLCGAVRYEAHLPFTKFVNRHCSRCRKASGSAFAAKPMGRRMHSAGSLGDNPATKPSTNVHWGSRAEWSVQSSELPTVD